MWRPYEAISPDAERSYQRLLKLKLFKDDTYQRVKAETMIPSGSLI